MALDLARLGKVAGIGGIALGAAVLVLQPLIESAVPILEPEARARVVLVVAVGAFVLGALGIVSWIIGAQPGRKGQRVVAGRDAALGGRDAITGSTVNRLEDGGGRDTGSARDGTEHQNVRAGRDAAVAGRDAVVRSSITSNPDAGRP